MLTDELPAVFRYRGRFAPSPTGPLHFGSLVAAVASYADALAHSGEWLVRIEDIDPQREAPGAAAAILASLRAHGFRFPEPLFQSTNLARYDQVLAELEAAGKAYHCSCTRQILRQSAISGRAGLIYPGTCRRRQGHHKRPATALRLLTAGAHVGFTDLLQGQLSCDVEREIGDFLLRRGDGFVGYQAAVVIDDLDQNITRVVRGTDLIDATFMQLALYRALDRQSPEFMHFPVVTGANKEKLSKQAGAPKNDDLTPEINIFRALLQLDQQPPESLQTARLCDLWQWAAEHWDPAPLRGIRSCNERSMIKTRKRT